MAEAKPGEPGLVRTDSLVSETLPFYSMDGKASSSEFQDGRITSGSGRDLPSNISHKPTFSKSFPAEEISDTDTDTDTDSSDEYHKEHWHKKSQSLNVAKLKVQIQTEGCDEIKDLNPTEVQQEQPKVWLDYYNSPSPPFPPGFLSDEPWSPPNKKPDDEDKSYPLRKTLYRKQCSDYETEESDTEEEDE